MHNPSSLNVDVATSATELAGEKPPFLLDVREPGEYETCHIKGSVLIPLQTLPQRLDEIPKDCPVIAYCHHGGRSMQAVRFLQNQGWTDVRNMEGGIDAWARHVDPDMPRY